MKKLISLIMSFVMLLSITMGMNLSVFADDGKTIISASLKSDLTVYEGAYNFYDHGIGYYAPADLFKDGDVLYVTFSNGTSDMYTFDGTHFNKKDESLFVSGNIYEDVKLGINEVELRINNEYDFPFYTTLTVVTNPVKSLSINTVESYEIIENTNGYNDEYDDLQYYNAPDFNDGDKITVSYTNGKSKIFFYKEFEASDNDENFYWDFVNDENETLNCNKYSFGFDGIGKTTFVVTTKYGIVYVPIVIIENPVDTFNIVPVKNYEISGDSIDDSGKGWGCTFPSFNENDIINLKYISGITDKFVYANGNFKNSKGEILDAEFSDVEQANPGETTTGIITLTKYNKSVSVPVKISSKTTSGGSTGGGGAAPAPTTDDSQKTEEQKPTTSTTTTTTTSTQTPATVKVSKTTAKKKGVVVTWKKVKNVTGYEIQLATDKKFKKNKKTVKVNKQNASKKTVKKLKSKKKYYVRVRSYKIVNGKKVYSKWSKIKTVKTK